MRIKNIIIIVLISAFIWGISLYNGWLKEIVLFGHNIINSWGYSAYNLPWSDDTTVKNSEFAYWLLPNVTIPENVTTIENSAFKGNKLSRIVIPSNVTYIGDKAFAKNKLLSITIGSDVLLGKDAFGFGFENAYYNNGKFGGTYTRYDSKSYEWIAWYNNLRYVKYGEHISIIDYNGTGGTVKIPEEINGCPVKIIGVKAFCEKKGISNVIISNSVTTIDDMAFFGAWDSYKKVPLGVISDVTFGNNVTTIGDRAFENNKLFKIYLPNSVKSIGYSAFADNQITRISIGANVKLGSKDSAGIIGENTGFNTAYYNNKSRAGTYTRPNVKSGTWTRGSR